MEKAALKYFAIVTGKMQTWALLKTDPNTVVFHSILRNLSEHLFRKTSANGCFWFFKTATEQLWVAASSVLTLLLRSDNLLTGYNRLSY